jgi:hypothetical protein
VALDAEQPQVADVIRTASPKRIAMINLKILGWANNRELATIF